MVTKKTTAKKKSTARKKYRRTAEFHIPEWQVIESFFTETDQIHMLDFSGGAIDLFEEESVRDNAADIFEQVSKGLMPPGNPWNAYQINSFYTWWKQSTIGTII